MGLGLSAGFGAGAAADELTRLLAQRKIDAYRAQQQAMEQQRLAMAEAEAKRAAEADTRNAAIQNFNLLQGQSLNDLPGGPVSMQATNGLPALPGTQIAGQAPPVAPARLPFHRDITPVEIPGVGGLAPIKLRPKSAEELIRAKEDAETYTLNPGDVRFKGGQPVAAAPNRPTAERGGSSDYAHALERYAASIGKTAETLTWDEEVAARKVYGQADDAARRPWAPVLVQTVDAQGNPVQRMETREAGKEFAASPTAEQRNRITARQNSAKVLDSIAELSERINTGQGAVAKITGAAQRAAATANLNDDISEYEAVVSGFTPMLARAVGHTGVLTEQDVQSVRKMLPNPGDSKSVRDRKIARINKIMGDLPGGDSQTGDGKKRISAADWLKSKGGG